MVLHETSTFGNLDPPRGDDVGILAVDLDGRLGRRDFADLYAALRDLCAFDQPADMAPRNRRGHGRSTDECQKSGRMRGIVYFCIPVRIKSRKNWTVPRGRNNLTFASFCDLASLRCLGDRRTQKPGGVKPGLLIFLPCLAFLWAPASRNRRPRATLRLFGNLGAWELGYLGTWVPGNLALWLPLGALKVVPTNAADDTTPREVPESPHSKA